ncbi:MAG: Rieske (2Fe-2S) protein [Bryobacteraceae bacterium]
MNEMNRELILGPLAAIPVGEARTFALGNERIAVFHTRSGELFATQADCPHRNGPLADGLLGNNTVICPLHAWKFDLRTGDLQGGDCKLKTYPVRTDAEGLVVLTVSIREPAISS